LARLDSSFPFFLKLLLSTIFQDMEINVALDELLGLRGPLSLLVRNLLWLLAFNATYLGIFGFIPKTVGFVVLGFFNTTAVEKAIKLIPYVDSENENRTTVVSILSKIEKESETRQTTFKLSDFATVTLGYLSIAACIVSIKYGLFFFRKAGQRFGIDSYARRAVANRENEGIRPVARREPLRRDRIDAMNEEAVDDDGLGISAALDATLAIVKVGVLLFLKMFLLPLSLGLWLDASTFELFGHDSTSRLAFAGGDLFSFILLHWVAGITFMLLVTVFLLQLREVVHPDILARLIRPQEPQPDLLGNLMHETVLTHMKRMALSLAIYAPLLTIHVTLPAKGFVASGLGEHFTFFHLHFCYLLMPQLQIPIELIIFHLSMLALLERYKNTIGGLQHSWMKFMCRQMGLTDYILPQSVKSFELVGSKAVFLTPASPSTQLEVDPFFLDLAKGTDFIDHYVLSNIDKEQDPVIHGEVRGETKTSGERVLSTQVDSISIPMNNGEKKLLPTQVGRYRLRLEEFCPSSVPEHLRIEFFREVQGAVIPRPPEGWDDLGQGGAFVQGRWAWGKERMSVIESGVAHRTPFRGSPNQGRPIKLIAKVAALMLLSWVAVTVTVLTLLSVPLAVGRSFYHLFRIPDTYVHDPFAFCIGAGLFFPLCSMLWKVFHDLDHDIPSQLRKWISHFNVPPRKKVLILIESLFIWLMAAPLMFGTAYELAVVKTPMWFMGREPFVDWKTLVTSWFMGIIVLNTSSFMLYYEFFTQKFWANVGNGMLEPPAEDNANNARGGNGGNEDLGHADAAEHRRESEHVSSHVLQGKNGVVARYFHSWKSILGDWSWDLVDKTILLDDLARPVAKQLASALLGSFLSFQVLHGVIISIFKTQTDGIVIPFIGLVGMGTVNQILFRCSMAMHITVQVATNCQERIVGAFEVAHEAARDDRYLVGELLINFNRKDQVAAEGNE
jgi:E3 ubiquitin-protein ligase MARCH6